MGSDKIFVLILTLAFFAFVGYLMWHSRKNQSKADPAGPADQPAANPAPEPPRAEEEPPAGKKGRPRSRRK